MTNAVLSLTEARINSNSQLADYVEKAKAVTIPLFPETVQFTDSALKYGAALVSVSTAIDSKGNNKDIYRNESGGYCLHLSKINEIAQSSGLQITDSRILERKVDEKGQVTFIDHQVKWKLKSVDGSIKEGVATGKYDYFQDLASKSEGQVEVRRKHAEAFAESNALTRAYNKAIAKLPQSFTLDELKKPFLIPYVIEDKDELLKDLPKEDQIAIKKEIARKRLGLIDTIYQTDNNNEPKQIEDATIIPESPVDEPKNEFSIEEQNHINAETFREAPQKERTEKILTLCALKNVKNPDGSDVTKAQVENPRNDLNKQIAFIEKLLNMKEVEQELPV